MKNKHIDITIFSIILILVHPVLMISYYITVGGADDFFHFYQNKDIHSIAEAGHQFITKFKNHDGRYTDTLFWIFTKDYPLLNYTYFKILVLTMTILLWHSLYFLTIRFTRIYSLTLSSLIFLLSISFIPKTNQFLTWNSAMGTYVIGTITAIYSIALTIDVLRNSYQEKKSSVYKIIAILFLITITIGSNESLSIICLIYAFISTVIYYQFNFHRITIKSITPFMVTLILAILVIFSPGSMKRKKNASNGVNSELVASFQTAVTETAEILYHLFVHQGGLFLLFITILIFIVNNNKNNLKPAAAPLALLGSFLCLVGTLFTTIIAVRYSLGVSHPLRLRVLNPTYIFIYIWILLMGYFASSILIEKTKNIRSVKKLVLLGFFSLLTLLFINFKQTNLNDIYIDLYSGRLEKHHNQVIELYKELNNSNKKTIEHPKLKAFKVQSQLPIVSIQDECWKKWVEKYYNKKKITFEKTDK